MQRSQAQGIQDPRSMLLPKKQGAAAAEPSEPSLPHTLSVYKASKPQSIFNFTRTTFMCLDKAYTTRYCRAHTNWMTEYRELQIQRAKPIPHKYPKAIRVKSGKPVLGNFFDSHGALMEYSEYTRNAYTFEHSWPDMASTIVINEEEVGLHFREGLYRASLTIEAPLDWWTLDGKKCNYIMNMESDTPAELLLTLEEYIGPLPPPPPPQEQTTHFIESHARKALSRVYKSLPQDWKVMVDDFCETFHV